MLRFIRPEQLARPEGFRNFVDYLAVLKAPTSPWLPSEWAAEMIMNWLTRVADPWPMAKLWLRRRRSCWRSAPRCTGGCSTWGTRKAQEGAERKVRRPLRGPGWQDALGWLPPQKREFLFKDLRLFFRDNTQWSQLILLAVLLMIYIFNIKSLPDPLGRADPVRAGHDHLVPQSRPGRLRARGGGGAVHLSRASRSRAGRCGCCARARSTRGRCSGASTGWAPCRCCVLAVGITVLTNCLLQVSPFMMAVSLVTIVLYTLAASALALTFGVFYPQFGTENAAQIPTSFGGIVYMMRSLCLLAVVIMIEAFPVTAQLRAWQRGEPLHATPELLARRRAGRRHLRGRDARPAAAERPAARADGVVA